MTLDKMPPAGYSIPVELKEGSTVLGSTSCASSTSVPGSSVVCGDINFTLNPISAYADKTFDFYVNGVKTSTTYKFERKENELTCTANKTSMYAGESVTYTVTSKINPSSISGNTISWTAGTSYSGTFTKNNTSTIDAFDIDYNGGSAKCPGVNVSSVSTNSYALSKSSYYSDDKPSSLNYTFYASVNNSANLSFTYTVRYKSGSAVTSCSDGSQAGSTTINNNTFGTKSISIGSSYIPSSAGTYYYALCDRNGTLVSSSSKTLQVSSVSTSSYALSTTSYYADSKPSSLNYTFYASVNNSANLSFTYTVRYKSDSAVTSCSDGSQAGSTTINNNTSGTKSISIGSSYIPSSAGTYYYALCDRNGTLVSGSSKSLTVIPLANLISADVGSICYYESESPQRMKSTNSVTKVTISNLSTFTGDLTFSTPFLSNTMRLCTFSSGQLVNSSSCSMSGETVTITAGQWVVEDGNSDGTVTFKLTGKCSDCEESIGYSIYKEPTTTTKYRCSSSSGNWCSGSRGYIKDSGSSTGTLSSSLCSCICTSPATGQKCTATNTAVNETTTCSVDRNRCSVISTAVTQTSGGTGCVR